MEPKSRPALPAYLVPLAMLSAGLLQALETMPDGEEGLTEPLPVTRVERPAGIQCGEGTPEESLWTLREGAGIVLNDYPGRQTILTDDDGVLVGDFADTDDKVYCLDLRRRSLRDRVALFLVRRLGGEYAAAERAWIEFDRASAVWGDANNGNPILGVSLCAHRVGAHPIVARQWVAIPEDSPDTFRLRITRGSVTIGSIHIQGVRPEHAEAIALGRLLRDCDRGRVAHKKTAPATEGGIELT